MCGVLLQLYVQRQSFWYMYVVFFRSLVCSAGVLVQICGVLIQLYLLHRISQCKYLVFPCSCTCFNGVSSAYMWYSHIVACTPLDFLMQICGVPIYLYVLHWCCQCKYVVLKQCKYVVLQCSCVCSTKVFCTHIMMLYVALSVSSVRHAQIRSLVGL